ncbi:MAG: CstA-like transporter-associated (seleno)protein [Candidatus Acidiferrum sp.]
MRRAWNGTKRGMGRLWQGLREWSGDAAYEKYRKCAIRQGVERPLSPEEFYVEQLNRKYSRPNRCC